MENLPVLSNKNKILNNCIKDVKESIKNGVFNILELEKEKLDGTEYFIKTGISRNGDKLLFKLDIVDINGNRIGSGKGNFLSYMLDIQSEEILFSGMKIEEKGKGLGNKLFKFFIDRLKKQGFKNILLNGGKPGVVLFFEKFGANPYKIKIGKGKNKKGYIYSEKNKEVFKNRKIKLFMENGTIYIIKPKNKNLLHSLNTFIEKNKNQKFGNKYKIIEDTDENNNRTQKSIFFGVYYKIDL